MSLERRIAIYDIEGESLSPQVSSMTIAHKRPEWDFFCRNELAESEVPIMEITETGRTFNIKKLLSGEAVTSDNEITRPFQVYIQVQSQGANIRGYYFTPKGYYKNSVATDTVIDSIGTIEPIGDYIENPDKPLFVTVGEPFNFIVRPPVISVYSGTAAPFYVLERPPQEITTLPITAIRISQVKIPK